jgi:hypothetical protein
MSDLRDCMDCTRFVEIRKNKKIPKAKSGYSICEMCIENMRKNDFTEEDIDWIHKIRLKKGKITKQFEYLWVTYSPKSDDVKELLKIRKKFLGGENINVGYSQVEWGNWDNIEDPKNIHFHAIISLKDNNRFWNLTRNRKLPAWKFVKLKKWNEKYDMDNLEYYKKYMNGEILNELDEQKIKKKDYDKIHRLKLSIE